MPETGDRFRTLRLSAALDRELRRRSLKMRMTVSQMILIAIENQLKILDSIESQIQSDPNEGRPE